MELQELIDVLIRLSNDHGLEDEGCVVQVNGSDVIAADWDGNTTIDLRVEA